MSSRVWPDPSAIPSYSASSSGLVRAVGSMKRADLLRISAESMPRCLLEQLPVKVDRCLNGFTQEAAVLEALVVYYSRRV